MRGISERTRQMHEKAVENRARGMSKRESLLKAGASEVTATKDQTRTFERIAKAGFAVELHAAGLTSQRAAQIVAQVAEDGKPIERLNAVRFWAEINELVGQEKAQQLVVLVVDQFMPEVIAVLNAENMTADQRRAELGRRLNERFATGTGGRPSLPVAQLPASGSDTTPA